MKLFPAHYFYHIFGNLKANMSRQVQLSYQDRFMQWFYEVICHTELKGKLVLAHGLALNLNKSCATHCCMCNMLI